MADGNRRKRGFAVISDERAKQSRIVWSFLNLLGRLHGCIPYCSLDSILGNENLWLVVNAELVETNFNSNQGFSVGHHQGYQLRNQLTRITRDKGALANDDRFDALGMAVAYWAKALPVDTEKVVQSNPDKLMKQELER